VQNLTNILNEVQLKKLQNYHLQIQHGFSHDRTYHFKELIMHFVPAIAGKVCFVKSK